MVSTDIEYLLYLSLCLFPSLSLRAGSSEENEILMLRLLNWVTSNCRCCYCCSCSCCCCCCSSCSLSSLPSFQFKFCFVRNPCQDVSHCPPSPPPPPPRPYSLSQDATNPYYIFMTLCTCRFVFTIFHHRIFS